MGEMIDSKHGLYGPGAVKGKRYRIEPIRANMNVEFLGFYGIEGSDPTGQQASASALYPWWKDETTGKTFFLVGGSMVSEL